MKHLLYIFLVLSGGLWAQTISPQVINSAGSHRAIGGSNASLTDNVGEPFTESLGPNSNVLLTQGFLQPEVVVGDFKVTPFKSDVTCSDKNDGKISFALVVPVASYSVNYIWTPSVVCPGGGCSSLDSLAAGSYSIRVVFTYTAGGVKTTTVDVNTITIADGNGPCKVKIFTGVNIAGSGPNAHFHIENITEFPNNRLTVYNRWGAQLYDEKGYDNAGKSWPSSDELSKLLPSTYFYVLDLGDGSKPIKGWLELVKN